MPDDPTLPSQPLPPDLVKAMAMDIGKEVAAYIERMYPKAVEATSSTFLTSLRNCVYNEIIATLGHHSISEIEQWLEIRKRERRKLRAIWKAVRTIKPGEFGKIDDIDDIIADRIEPAPDL